MSSRSRLFLLVVAIGFSLGVVVVFLIANLQSNEPELITVDKPVKEAVSKPVKEEKETVPEKPLPDRVVLNVPFYSQAPFAVWDSLHKETCEEASLHMVRDYYLKESQNLEQQDKSLIDYVNWQTKQGYKFDITLKELADTAADYYGFSGYKIINNPTIEEIKREIAAGRPVIAPAAGRLLDNPYFTAPGPIYHMLVIKGYDKTGFITNDPGTRRGKDFHYSYQNLYNAIHDWNPVDILSGNKSVLVYIAN